MKTFLFTCCFTLLSLVLPAQKNSFFWMLSDSIGLEFDSTGVKKTLNTKSVNDLPFPGINDIMIHNSAYWNDEEGLLLYSDGRKLYDANNRLIQDMGHVDGVYTISSLMLPLDQKGDSVMLFRVGLDGYFTYSLIRRNAEREYDIAPEDKDITISQDTFTAKFLAIRHANNRDWWVIQHENMSNIFWVILIENDVLTKIKKQAIGQIHRPEDGSESIHFISQMGQINTNPQGNKIVLVTQTGILDLFDFDKCTGIISNHNLINKHRNEFPNGAQWGVYYGCSISPNERFIYTSDFTSVIQYDLYPEFPNNPRYLTDTIFDIDRDYKTTVIDPWIKGNQPQNGLYQHYVGKDGKIYIHKNLITRDYVKTLSPWDSSLAVINEPNKKWKRNVGFEINGVPIPNGYRIRTGMYAPTYSPDEPLKAGISASDTVVCVGDSVQFFNNSCGQLSHEWRLDDWQSDTSQNPIRKYIQPGIYKTKLLLTTYRPAGITHLEITVRVKDCLKADFSTKTVESDTCGQVWVQFIPEMKQGTPSLIEWDFGDGQTSNEISPLHLYSQIGTFKPTLKVSNTDDELTIQALEEVIVEPCPTEPQEFKLYPNPNNGTFTLEYITEETLNFEVFNVLGQLIASIPILPKLKKHELTLDVAEGVYFYRVNLPSGKYVSGKLLVME